jgi:RNA polymerase sigma-70 factor (ECF subfamily)
VDCFRKRRRFENDAIPLDECDVAVPPLQEEISRYRQAIDGLSEKTRVIFLFQRVHGLTYKEISHRLGISVSTVEYHMMRALVHIDQALEEL